MKKFFLLLLVLLIAGCESSEGLYVYAVFEYTDGNGYFYGYFLDDWGRSVTDRVRITINDSRTFEPEDTSRYYLSEVFPGAQFKVKFSHPDFPDVVTSVEIPAGFTITKFDGYINAGENDTIIWEPAGEPPQYWEVVVRNTSLNFVWTNYYDPEDTMAIITSDIFTFSGNYEFSLEALNFSDIDKASSQSIIVGVYTKTRSYTVNR